MSEVFFVQMTESKMAEFKMAAIIKLSQNEWVNFFEQNGRIQDGRIQMAAIINLSENAWVKF